MKNEINTVRSIFTEKYMDSLCSTAKKLGYDYTSASLEEKAKIKEKVEEYWNNRAKEAEREELAQKEFIKASKQKSAWDYYRESVPRAFKEANIQHFKADSPIVLHIMNGGSALIIGDTGVGKTHLAYACAKELAYNRADATSVRVVDMSSMLSDVKKLDSDWLRAIKEKYGTVQTLFIDEFDKMFGSAADYQLVSHLINARWEEELQTVVMGNGSEEMAKNLLGAAAISRLVGRGTGGAFFSVGGLDRRRA